MAESGTALHLDNSVEFEKIAQIYEMSLIKTGINIMSEDTFS
jgi:hypothetical protein